MANTQITTLSRSVRSLLSQARLRWPIRRNTMTMTTSRTDPFSLQMSLVVSASALAVWLGISSSAQAQFNGSLQPTFWTGNDLLQYCTGTNPAMRAVCEGFTWGVADAIAVGRSWNPSFEPLRACILVEVSGTQVRDVVIRWLQSRPEERQVAAAALEWRALAAAWPCRG
jgi:hypothetical protein